MAIDIDWPRYETPADLAAIEATPLADRGLPATTYELLARAATLRPDRTAVSVLPDAAQWQQPSERTFAELLADVHRVANLLHHLSIRRNDAVALIAPNSLDLIVATLAAQLAGIAAPINGGLTQTHTAELLRRSGARVLITATPHDGTAVDHVLEIHELFDRARDFDSSVFAGEPPSSTDLAALFHTGGTTGMPKLAAHTHRNEVADAWMIAANTLLDRDSVVFAALPLFHVNALVVTLLAPLLKGQQVLWAGPLGYRDPELYSQFWKIVDHYGVTTMSAVPTVYSVLSQCPINADISSLRFAMVGASPLPVAVREGFETHTGVTLIEGYGLTEATCASARSFPDAHRAGAVGQRMPYQRVKVVHISDKGIWEDVAPGGVGVLAIKGPNVFPGYVVDHKDGLPVLDGLGKLVDGWLDTGDLARIDDDGFIHLTGRAKDLIIRGGHNIDPAVIEDALLSHPSVTAASAIGRPDKHAGEVPVAYVALIAGAGADEEELLAWACDRIPEQAAVPKAIAILAALPVTDVGKPYKLALRADATRDVVTDELSGLDGIRAISTRVDDGSVNTEIVVATQEAETAVRERLGSYALTWRVVLDQ